jgi:hypothetical protein
MAGAFHLVVKVLSAFMGIMLLSYGIESFVGQQESSDLQKSVLFMLSSASFGLNLIRLPRLAAFVVAALHVTGLIYVAKFFFDLARYAFGEGGGWSAWIILLPAMFISTALLASVAFNLVRPDDALRRG